MTIEQRKVSVSDWRRHDKHFDWSRAKQFGLVIKMEQIALGIEIETEPETEPEIHRWRMELCSDFPWP